MKPRVSASEAALLKVARAVVGVAPIESATPILRGRIAVQSSQIGPTAMAILQSTLRTGVVRSLAFANGGRDPAPWRTPLHLSFTEHTMRLLQWMAWAAPDAPWDHPPGGSRGDAVFEYLAAGVLARTRRRLPEAFGHNLLIQIAFPHLTAGPAATAERWVTGEGAIVLEALSPRLSRELVAIERRKAATADCEAMWAFEGQIDTLDTLLDAADAHQRRDLASFIVNATQRVLAAELDVRWWIGALDLSARLADRERAARAATGLLAATARIGTWHQQHGLVPFFDEEYDAAQRLLVAWEPFGREGFERSAALAHGLGTLYALGA